MNSYKSVESTKKAIDFIDNKIYEYNELNVPLELSITSSKLNRHIQDDSGHIIAGINCIYYSRKCIYDNCHLIQLDTFDFQAKLGIYFMRNW